jgi:hypothetical protein
LSKFFSILDQLVLRVDFLHSFSFNCHRFHHKLFIKVQQAALI